MLKAAKERGGVRAGEELTVLPVGAPPPGHGWIQGHTIDAPSGNVYRIYTRGPAHSGAGPVGTHTNAPVSDTGTLARMKHKPHAPTGVSPGKTHHRVHHRMGEGSREAEISERLMGATKDLKNILANQAATEKQITEKMQAGLAAARDAQLVGSGKNDAGATAVLEQVGKAIERVEDMRNAAFEADLNQEARSPGSVSDDKLKKGIQNVLAGERDKQMLGVGSDKGPPKAMALAEKAIGIVANRKGKALRNLLDQERRSAGSVSDARFSSAIGELLGVRRECEMLGVSSPGSDDYMANVAEVIKISVQRKADAKRKLLQQKQIPGSGVTDQQIQKATDDLAKAIQQARVLGVSVPDATNL